jgi:microcystin-dependent protein
MSEPFIAEIKIFGFNFAPRSWAMCNGQLLPINQNQALFSLLGTTYGGDGRTTFALPNLQGRAPLHPDTQFPLGNLGGEASHTLIASEVPPHTHQAQAGTNSATGVASPTGAYWGQSGSSAGYRSGTDTTLNAGAIASAGGGQAHENRQPYLVLNYCIALTGIFPSRS